MNSTDQEQAMLDILGQDAEETAQTTREDLDSAFPELTDKGKDILTSVMGASLPTLEELALQEKRVEHNAAIRTRRELDLQKRKLRRKTLGSHSRKHRKKRNK